MRLTVRKPPRSDQPAHSIWWRAVHEIDSFGITAQAAKAAERPPRLRTLVVPNVLDPLGPLQLAGYSKKRKRITIQNVGLYPMVLLTARTADVADGFTVKPGKITLECHGALWATCTTAYPIGTKATVLETYYADVA